MAEGDWWLLRQAEEAEEAEESDEDTGSESRGRGGRAAPAVWWTDSENCGHARQHVYRPSDANLFDATAHQYFMTFGEVCKVPGADIWIAGRVKVV